LFDLGKRAGAGAVN